MSNAAPEKSNTLFYIGIGLVFLLLAIPMIGIFAAVGIPNFISYSYKSKHSEAKSNLRAIRTMQEAYQASFDTYLYIRPYPKRPSKNVQRWEVSQSGGFQDLGWEPDGGVRGSYSVTTTMTDFRAVGVMDIDGDGNYATFVATKSTAPYQVTSPDVY